MDYMKLAVEKTIEMMMGNSSGTVCKLSKTNSMICSLF